jgi:ATP-binding cassette, subfamily A (ABC1), member 3
LGLDTHRTKLSGKLSGGNKRKLCVAIAMIGNPQIILLDEPSAGMDPESRRFMWSVVGRIARKKTSAVVLTTHSMEEAEALSTKMGIMVKGGIFKCFGSAQHIRNKFGTGYVIEIKIRAPEQRDLDRVVEESLVDGKLKMNSELFDISVQESIQ